MAEPARRALFGGAISVVLPDSFIDASTFRQVPDAQEVFVSNVTDASFVIEILERVEPDDPSEAAKFHFSSLAHDNDAVSSEVTAVEVPSLPGVESSLNGTQGTPSPIMLEGTQKMPKFNRSSPDTVQILVSLFRIKSKNVDLVLSANLPLKTEAGRGLSEDSLQAEKAAFMTAVRTLRIEDFGLFV